MSWWIFKTCALTRDFASQSLTIIHVTPRVSFLPWSLWRYSLLHVMCLMWGDSKADHEPVPSLGENMHILFEAVQAQWKSRGLRQSDPGTFLVTARERLPNAPKRTVEPSNQKGGKLNTQPYQLLMKRTFHPRTQVQKFQLDTSNSRGARMVLMTA